MACLGVRTSLSDIDADRFRPIDGRSLLDTDSEQSLLSTRGVGSCVEPGNGKSAPPTIDGGLVRRSPRSARYRVPS